MLNLQILEPEADQARYILRQVLRLRAPQLCQRRRPDLLHRHVPRISVPRVWQVGLYFAENTLYAIYVGKCEYAQGCALPDGGANQRERRPSQQSLSKGTILRIILCLLLNKYLKMFKFSKVKSCIYFPFVLDKYLLRE